MNLFWTPPSLKYVSGAPGAERLRLHANERNNFQHCCFNNVGSTRESLDLDSSIMISDLTIKRKIKKTFQHPKLSPQGEFQLRNPNPDFMVSLLNRFLENSRKDMQNCSREQCLTEVFCGPFFC